MSVTKHQDALAARSAGSGAERGGLFRRRAVLSLAGRDPDASRAEGMASAQPGESRQSGSTNDESAVPGAVADWLRSSDDARRIAARTQPAVATLGVWFEVAEAAAITRLVLGHLRRRRDRDLVTALDLVRSLEFVIRAAGDGFRDLAFPRVGERRNVHAWADFAQRELIRAGGRVGGLVRYIDEARDSGLVRFLSRDVASARKLGHKLDHDLLRAGRHVYDLAQAGAGALRDRDLARAVLRDLETGAPLARAEANDLAADLRSAVSDFTAVDLERVDLSGVPLVGLRWSPVTKWPSGEWRTRAVRSSPDLGAGVYEIQAGAIAASA